MLAIINYNLNMLRLFPLLLLLAGCDKILEEKYKVRLLLGLATPTPVPETTAAVKDFTKEGEKIVEITPQKKFYNLIYGYISNPGPGIKNILIREFQVNGKIFKAEDPELISALGKLSLLIQEGNMDALEIVFNAYANLEGNNLDPLGAIVATGFDYQPKKTLELYLSLKKDPHCSLVSAMGKDFDEEKKLLVFEARKNNIGEVVADTTIPESLKLLIKECEKSLQLEVVKMNLKKTPVPMPTQELDLPEAMVTPESSN